jgi:hypothetical protein
VKAGLQALKYFILTLLGQAKIAATEEYEKKIQTK